MPQLSYDDIHPVGCVVPPINLGVFHLRIITSTLVVNNMQDNKPWKFCINFPGKC